MKVVTVPTKDVGEVRDCFKIELGYKKTFEDRNEDYIKRDGMMYGI